MQSVSQAWYVYQMSNSEWLLGLDAFLNTIPITLFSFSGGLIADRFNRRFLFIGLQTLHAVLAVLLGVLIQTNHAPIPVVLLFSFLTGLVQSVAWPTYQALLGDLSGPGKRMVAIGWNSVQFNVSRMVGPLIGAYLFQHMGASRCFYLNALSFLLVIGCLGWVDLSSATNRSASKLGWMNDFWDGWSYLKKRSDIISGFVLVALTTFLAIPAITLLPVFVRVVFSGTPTDYGHLYASFGLGAVISGLALLLNTKLQNGVYARACQLLFVFMVLGFSISRSFGVSLLLMGIAGFSLIGFMSSVNHQAQEYVPEALRGRLISFFVFSFGGILPFGNLLAGWTSKMYGAPLAIAVQSSVLLFISLGLFYLNRKVIGRPLFSGDIENR